MNLKEFLLDTLFPPHCLICKTRKGENVKSRALCDSCKARVIVHETLFCLSCRARLAEQKRICHADAPLRLASVGTYTDLKLKSLITQLKYERKTSAVKALGALTEDYLEKLAFDFTGYNIIPIPLHPTRERERGFNQSLLLARQLAHITNLPLLDSVLTKIKPTLAQAKTKNLEERKDNLRNCFELTSGTSLQNKKIILMDDVCTSGATLTEAATTLKRAGAKNIIGFVMART